MSASWSRILLAAAFVTGVDLPAGAQEQPGAERHCEGAVAETIYVPAFSKIYTQSGTRQPLSSTLVIHNVDPKTTISVNSVSYFDQNGSLVSNLVEEPEELGPFASASFLTELNDDRGGVGANYVVEWSSKQAVCSPATLTVMIGGIGTQGISFALEGRVIARETAATE